MIWGEKGGSMWCGGGWGFLFGEGRYGVGGWWEGEMGREGEGDAMVWGCGEKGKGKREKGKGKREGRVVNWGGVRGI